MHTAASADAALTETDLDRIMKVTTLEAALAIAKPTMRETYNIHGVTGEPPSQAVQGRTLLASWSVSNLHWSDVYMSKNETSYGAVYKDPNAERGKRLCTSGQVDYIRVVRLPTGTAFEGIFQHSEDVYAFTAVGSTAGLVARSPARLCGIATGTHDYSNSGGGVSHAVKLVGMFDLPENRARN